MIRILAVAAVCLTFGACSRHQAVQSNHVSVFDTQVRNAVHMGDGDLEVQALRKRLLENPRDLTVRRRLAEKFEAHGYPELALDHLRIAAEIAPADLDLQLDLAKALDAQKLPHQASQVLAAALPQSTPSATQWSRAAILTDSVATLADGEALHRKALILEPANHDFTNNLAFNLIRQKRGAEAEQLLTALLRAKPTHELARNNLAMLYASQLNRPDEALLHWKAIHGPAAAHNNLAVIYMEMEKWAEARQQLEQALTMRFQFPEALQNLQIVASRTGGTVTLNLERDKTPSSLSKLAKAFRQAFVVEETEKQKSKSRRSRS
jgi:Flp pilus assembly protein TadD